MYSLDPEKFDINEFDSLLAATFLYKSFEIGQPVLTEIISSGKLSIIQNDQIRFKIIGWGALLEKAQKEDEFAYRYLESIFMYSLDYVSWRNSDKFDPDMIKYDQGNRRLKPDNRSALSSFPLENRIGQFLWYIDNVQTEYTNLLRHIEEISMLLESEIE